MKSLRSRITLGFVLLTTAPLLLVMNLLSTLVASKFKEQEASRLSATVQGMALELESDGKRVAEQIGLLAKDPALKRLYLLRPGAGWELTEYLEERRVLLGLDFLAVSDTSRTLVGEALDPGVRAPVRPGIAPSRGVEGPLMAPAPDDSGLALAAAAPISYPNEPAGYLFGGLILNAETVGRLGSSSGLELELLDAGGRVVATTFPDPVEAKAGPIHLERVAGASYLVAGAPLQIGDPPAAALAGFAPTAAADRAIQSLRVGSALLALAGLGLAIVLGALWSRQVSGPVERLAEYSEKLSRGEWDEPLDLKSVRELDTLVSAFERMRGDLRVFREKLVVSERQAAWSQMARKVAHEVKNPLTPIAISVADLKRSFDQKRPDFPEILDQAVRTVSEEVETLRRLLQEFSDYGRFPAPRIAPCGVSALLADLEPLYRREISEGRLAISPPAEEITISADPEQIRQALINLIKNGLEAVDGRGRVEVSARRDGQMAELVVTDTGPGLTAEQRKSLFAPGFTTKARGSGLGLTIVERIVSDHGGTIAVDEPGPGTTFRVRLLVETVATSLPSRKNVT